MRLSRLYTDQPLTLHSAINLNHKQSHYLTHVLRLKPQQNVILFNGVNEYDFLATIIKTGKAVVLETKERLITANESPLNTTIYQALSKNEHMDFMVQKCTELGVNSIVIFNSEHTQIPLKVNKQDKKLNHWQQIAFSACEQCGRSITPSIHFIPKFYSALESQNPSEQRYLLDFNGDDAIQLINNKRISSIDILLGAEGGLSSTEVECAKQHQFKGLRLGPRVLRTETAAISALSILQMLAGDLT